MSDIPNDLKFAKSHEWARLEDDGTVTIGITNHAQELLGDLVFVDLPEVEQVIAEGDECAVVESVKAASDVYSPLAGTIIEVNNALSDEPELVNSSPYENGWLFKLKPENANLLDEMLDAESYGALLMAEAD